MIKSYANNAGYVKNVKFEGFTLSAAAYPICAFIFKVTIVRFADARTIAL